MGWRNPARSVTGLRVPILMYHEVAGRPDTRSRLAVPPASFAAQLAYLRDAGFSTITFAQAAAALADGGVLPDRAVVLTFDDGFADFHREALPLLSRYGFTATVFVTTGWIADAGRHSAGNRPGQMLCWTQIREAVAAGVEIGAHSHAHPQLDQLKQGRLEDELATSKALLEDGIGRAVPSLAYPFGYSSARVRRTVRSTGYSYACAVANAVADSAQDRFALPRLTVRASTRQTTFEHIARGEHPAHDLPQGPCPDQGMGGGQAFQGRAGWRYRTCLNLLVLVPPQATRCRGWIRTLDLLLPRRGTVPRRAASVPRGTRGR
jgi:peptidoglycan/xylan/chitin deacetylase (PgdA/CDA1 family)